MVNLNYFYKYYSVNTAVAKEQLLYHYHNLLTQPWLFIIIIFTEPNECEHIMKPDVRTE